MGERAWAARRLPGYRGAMANVNPIEVQKYLKGTSYPTTRAELVKTAKGEDAPSEVTDALGKIPDGEYAQVTDVTKALGSLN